MTTTTTPKSTTALHDRPVGDPACACEPGDQPHRGIGLHPLLDIQRGRGVLDLLLRPLHRTRGGAPGIHPSLRLDLAPHVLTVDARARRTASPADPDEREQRRLIASRERL